MTVASAHQPRLSVPKAAPAGYQAMLGLEKYLSTCPLPHELLLLVKLRASQINGCGFCVDMHSRDARKEGESEERLFAVAAWRDTPYFTDAERAALALTEAATRLSDREDPVPDEIWQEAARHYDEETLAALVVAIATINAWNRITVATRTQAGARH